MTPPRDIAGRVAVMQDWAAAYHGRGETFYYVRIPEPLSPGERVTRYQLPLDAALRAAGVGKVDGGGQQPAADADAVVYCGVDVVVRDRLAGLAFLRAELGRLGAPAGTVIEEFFPAFTEHPLTPAGP